jgi:hypothetical protein
VTEITLACVVPREQFEHSNDMIRDGGAETRYHPLKIRLIWGIPDEVAIGERRHAQFHAKA